MSVSFLKESKILLLLVKFCIEKSGVRPGTLPWVEDMASVRQKEQINQLIPVLSQIGKMRPEHIVQRERLGSELSFEFLLPLFIEICSSAEELQKFDLERIPHGVLQQIFSHFQQIHSLLQQIANFSPSQHGNAIQARDSYANSLEDQWNSVYLTVRTVLLAPQQDTSRKEFEMLASQIKASIQLSSEAADALRAKQVELEQNLSMFLNDKSLEFEREGENKLKLVSAALDEVRKAAAEAGVSQTAVHFKEEADEHLGAATWWLVALIAVTIALLFFSLFGNQILIWAGSPPPSSNADNFEHIRYFSQKGLIIFCLIFGLIWVARNYGASRHNYVVNKHRNNALGSFQAFVASATDDQTKNAVLIQATQSIFSPQPSGYVKTDGDNATNSPVLEIVRAVGGSPKDK